MTSAEPASPIRVLIVDDDPLVRAGLSFMLGGAPDLEIVGEAADGDEVAAAVARTRPDVVLMDIRMPGVDGIEATRRIIRDGTASHDPRVLILTTFDLDEYVIEAVRAGASGFLLKDSPPEELTQAVRVVAAGEALLSPKITRALIADYATRPSAPVSPDATLSVLTDRELDVMKAVAAGLSNAEIAAELHLAEQTVKTHVSRILNKLDLRDRTQLVVCAYESGLVRAGR